MDDISDEKLVELYLKGDQKSLDILIESYLKPIYTFIYRYTNGAKESEDITQDVFVKVWRNIKKFDTSKKFKTWIFAIAKNASIDYLKKKKPIFFDKDIKDNSPLPDEIYYSKEMSVLVSSALEKLSPKYRMVLFLRYNDHFTFEEIAETLGEPYETIKSRHRRAILMLREIMHPKT